MLGAPGFTFRRTAVADWDEYVSYAEQCLSIARTVTSRDTRIILREMAAEWTKIAQAVDREQPSERPAE